MKIKCFLVWAFLVFLLFSCSYELEGPPPFDATALDNFGVADARYYFEENASDLSYVRFSEHQHHPSTRSEEEGYPELSPDWSRAVRTENTEAVLVEVPIRAEQVMLSVVRHFEDGKFRLSRVCESRVRLMIARRSNGRTQMFVTTLVPSAKYPPREQDIENFRYLGGGNFTGKVFCSTLDGHFVEASQYVNGRFIGMLDVTTRKQLSERGESLEGTSYESIMLSSALKTKSGTYFFSEGGSSYNPCPYHPQYSAGSCPYCLDEVIVRNCQYCGARLENGQTCNCRSCSRCGYYPCRCCNYCLGYPCTCVSKCEICRPYSCTKCNECGRHYCFGACKQTGGGDSGDTGTSGGGNTSGGIGNVEKPGKHTLDSTDVLAKKSIASFKRKAQRGNTCVPTVMEYISKLLGDKNGNDRKTFIKYFENLSSSTIEGVYKVKWSGTQTTQIPGAIIHYFGKGVVGNIAYGANFFDYKACIDAGSVVMTNIPVTTTMWHNILIIGYTKQGNYIYIDPNDNANFYICPLSSLQSTSTYKYNFEIKLK